MWNVYRRLVKNFAKVAAPLVKRTSKEAPEKQQQLNDEHIESFTLLEEALFSTPILRLPRKGLPYSVDTDASDGQIGCSLFQTYEDKKRYPIGYRSRTLNRAEKNYSVSEKECLAVVWARTNLRPVDIKST